MSKIVEPTSVRTFLAIGISEELRGALRAVGEQLSGSRLAVKWVAPELLHVTVRFLGNVDTGRLVEVGAAAGEAASAVGPFELRASGLGAFPNERAPRVVWAGLMQEEGYQRLQALYTRTERALQARGFPGEARPYAPHLTLARVRDNASGNDRQAVGRALQELKRSVVVDVRFLVTELMVMSSALARSGPTYTVLQRAPLGMVEEEA